MKFSALAIASLAVITQAYHEPCVVGKNGVQAADWRAVGKGCKCPRHFKYDDYKGCVEIPKEHYYSSSSDKHHHDSSSSSSYYESSSSSSHYKSETTKKHKKPNCVTGTNGVIPADFVEQTGKCVCPATFAYDAHKGCIKPQKKNIHHYESSTSDHYHY